MQPQNIGPDPDRQREIIKGLLKAFFDEQDAETAQWEAWGFPGLLEDEPQLPPGVFRFDQAVEQDWCKYGLRELVKFLERARYPERFMKLRLLTKRGYEKASEYLADLKRQKHAKRQRDNRAALREEKTRRVTVDQKPSSRSRRKSVP
jgi:hypothetical protein